METLITQAARPQCRYPDCNYTYNVRELYEEHKKTAHSKPRKGEA